MAESPRLLSLDALRGLTIAAMVVVNTPGTWSSMYAPLRHAPWHGLTPTDLVFPFFLVIVGVSLAFSFSRQLQQGVQPAALRRRALLRAAKLFAVGVLLNLWPDFVWAEVRWAGVLQRIAVVFLFASWLFLALRWRGLAATAVALLVGYWGLLAIVPVPRDSVINEALITGSIERAHGLRVPVAISTQGASIEPNLSPGTNLAAWVDRRILPGTFYERTWDPEGLLSTLPAVASTLVGILVGLLLHQIKAWASRALGLALLGFVLLVVGYAWATLFPLNKNLWTGSFVLVSTGWLLLVLAGAVALVDGCGWKRMAFPVLVFGANPIAAYVLASLGTVLFVRDLGWGESLASTWMNAAQHLGASAELGSFLFSLAYAALIFVPLLLMYRKRWFWRM